MRHQRSAAIFVFVLSLFFVADSFADGRAITSSPVNDDGLFHSVTISPNVRLVTPEFVGNQILDGLTEDQKRTLLSIKMIEGTSTYVMTYYGSYGSEDDIEENLDAWPQLSQPRLSCSTFSASTPSGQPIFAYNNDNSGHDYTMLIFANPPDGFATICISLSRFCRIREYALDEYNIGLRDFILTAPHYSFDGINEYGVTMSPMSNHDGEWVSDPNKRSLHGLTTIRLVLHCARDVHEAITLLRRYNNSFSNNIHYLLSDAHGNSVVIEYYDGEVKVIWRSGPFQVCTNNRVLGYQNDQTHWQSTCWRYSTLLQRLTQLGGVVSESGAFDLLSEVAFRPTAQSDSTRTIWSSVYNNLTGEWRLCLERNYDNPYTFSMPMVVDLAVGKIKLLTKPGELEIGGKVRLFAQIRNVGIRPTAPAEIDFYLSKKKKVGKKSVLLKSGKVKALPAGKKKKVRVSANIPSDLKSGNYYLIASIIPTTSNNDPNPLNNLRVTKKKYRIQ